MVLEAALKGAGWPADAAKIAAAMENLKVDTKGLRGGPIEWSKDNHFRTRQYYRVYRWDAGEIGRRAGQGLGRLRRQMTGTLCRHRGRANAEAESISESSLWIPDARALPATAMTARQFVQLIVNIAVLAAIYALLACGYVLIYRVSRVMNLAHGELMMLGAYLLSPPPSLFAGHPCRRGRGGGGARASWSACSSTSC